MNSFNLLILFSRYTTLDRNKIIRAALFTSAHTQEFIKQYIIYPPVPFRDRSGTVVTRPAFCTLL